MLKLRIIFQCVGEAVYAKGLKAVARLVPFGESIYDIAAETWDRLNKRCAQEQAAAARAAAAAPSPTRVEAELKQGLEEAARLTPEQVRQEAAAAAKQVCAGQPPEIQEAMAAYLGQMPGVIRRSLRRPQDPTGTTVPRGLSLRKPEELLPFLPTNLPRFKPGDRPVGNWQLVELLGVGGFGEVWKAEHPQLKELPPVALKFCLDPTAATYLRHEANLLARVMQQRNKPGLVALRQAYLDKDPVCLEYEYIDGGDLTGVARQLSAAPPKKRVTQACEIVRRLARTVGAAHRLEPPIVHRDLKPANVLVRKGDRGKLEFLIADFGIGGIAAQQALNAVKKGTTANNSLLATALRGSHTPLYASPQQAQGEPPDPRDDVHALGVIWYQLLSGDLNSGAPTGLDWADDMKAAGMSEDLVRLLGSCVNNKADRRPADAADLAAKMTKFITESQALTVELVEEVVQDVLPADDPLPPAAPTQHKPAPTPTQRQPRQPEPQTVLPVVPVAPSRSSKLPVPKQGNKFRYFEAPDLRLDDLLSDLERWLASDGFEWQALDTEDGGTLLQIQRPGGWRAWVGMSTAMNIVLRQGDGQLMVEIGAGRWVDKAAGGAVGMLVLWPLAVTAAIGAWDQMQMPERVMQQVAAFVSAHRRKQPVTPQPTPPPAPVNSPPAKPAGIDMDVFAQLERLATLKERGIITDEEFQKQKAKLLG